MLSALCVFLLKAGLSKVPERGSLLTEEKGKFQMTKFHFLLKLFLITGTLYGMGVGLAFFAFGLIYEVSHLHTPTNIGDGIFLALSAALLGGFLFGSLMTISLGTIHFLFVPWESRRSMNAFCLMNAFFMDDSLARSGHPPGIHESQRSMRKDNI